jgi:alanine racemase
VPVVRKVALDRLTGETDYGLATRPKNLDEAQSSDMSPGGMAKARRASWGAVPSFSPAATSGSFSPAAEIDMRTSIRPTIAEVDLGAIKRNLERVTALVGQSSVWTVIKADGYGHGAVPVARAISDRCEALAVSLVEEGLELRAAGITVPIVVLGAYYDHCHAQVLDEGLVPVIYDPQDLDFFARAAVGRRDPVEVHIKIDTGMSRLGIDPARLPEVLDRVAALPALRLGGLCTHFATADGVEREGTAQALDRFRRCLDVAHQRGLGPLKNHAANSAAAVRFPDARLDAVRPGLAVFGAMASSAAALPELEPALRFSTRVMAIRQVATGTTVSYGAQWRAPRPSLIATLPVGYADGYPRHVRSAETLVRGHRAPIVGAVCMDMMMIDVTDVPGATVGDVVTLIGRDGSDRIGVDDLAAWAGTINYEILCGISKRVPRVYKG